MSKEYDLSTNASGAADALDDAQKKIMNSLSKKMEKACAFVELAAKQNCPVKSGQLRASITHKVQVNKDNVIGVIGSPLAYAPYVHQGTGLYAVNGDGRQEVPWRYQDKLTGKWYSTKGQKPNPFLQNAINDNKDKLNEIFGGPDK